MLSGIGDKSELSKHGIKCISNVPAVGKNMEEHPVVVIIGPKLKDVNASDMPRKQRTACEGLYLVTDDDEYEYIMEVVTNAQGEFWGFGCFDNEDEVHVLVFQQVEHYTSRGIVGIRSSDDEDKPIIDPQYLSNKVDEMKCLEAFKMQRKS